MDVASTLAETLARHQRAGPEWLSMYGEFVSRLRGLGIGDGAPRAGDAFPDFKLPDHRGRFVSLSSLLEPGLLVLSFNRGSWCPYCRSELEAWAASLSRLARDGVAFAAVTPETGGRAARFAHIVEPAVTLCDVDHGLALRVGLAFQLASKSRSRYAELGLDLAAIYGGDSGFMPVPATFLIDRDRLVRYAFVEPDFRLRAEPSEVLAAIEAL